MKVKAYKYIILVVMALVCSHSIEASTESERFWGLSYPGTSMLPDSTIESHLHFKISYRVDRHDLDTAYMANHDNINLMRLAFSNPDDIDSIEIYSFASPEGPLQHNIYLARNRAERARVLVHKLLKENGVYLDDSKIKIRIRGENWDDLYTSISRNKDAENREMILEILDDESLTQEQKKKEIRRLGWKTWRYVIDKVMPQLRSAEIVCHYHNDLLTKKLDMLYTIKPVQLAVPKQLHVNEQPLHDAMDLERRLVQKRTRIAVKTNMLYDAMMWANFSLEVPFKINDQKFSVTYDHQFPWWRWGKGNNRFCNRYLQIGGEARWWFAPQRKPRTKKKILRECLAGHYLGLYGMGGKYDFEWSRQICYQGEFWSGGITYGYAMPISRKLNLEFFISLGYASIDYRHFMPSDDFDVLYRDIDKMGRLDYFGVTKLGVSLVLPIDFKYRSKGKGENL